MKCKGHQIEAKDVQFINNHKDYQLNYAYNHHMTHPIMPIQNQTILNKK